MKLPKVLKYQAYLFNNILYELQPVSQSVSKAFESQQIHH